ncbi:MAG: hypothetical protein QM820_08250 [Minicystis sp.]
MKIPAVMDDDLDGCSGLGLGVLSTPYRMVPVADPAVGARLEEALTSARRERRGARRRERRLTWIAVSGYLAAALLAGPGGEDRLGKSHTAAWTCVAAGATYALLLAGRAGGRAHELEAEIAGIERLSEMVARSPRG